MSSLFQCIKKKTLNISTLFPTDKEIPLIVNSIFISIEIGLRKMQLSKYKQIKVVNLPLVL